MLITISPAKTLDFETPPTVAKHSNPLMLEEAETLIEIMRKKTKSEITTLMNISDKIATLNVERYQRWSKQNRKSSCKQAIYAFMGDVYTGLDAYSLDKKDIEYAQKHLRILSGLYGLLRPLDTMQAYRLEMGTKLLTEKGRTLYDFWGDEITKLLNKHARETQSRFLVNLASEEYFKAVNKAKLDAELITPIFKDEKNGKFKVVSFYAKKARGMMAKFLIESRIKQPSDIGDFCSGGYYLDGTSSSESTPIFLRKEQHK
ncbi:MAG: peroxide stress protein YaaA [Pseudomonadota bacterium]|nr:peroxide stress protein YaaA [Pseudomonadota bacterium]